MPPRLPKKYDENEGTIVVHEPEPLRAVLDLYSPSILDEALALAKWSARDEIRILTAIARDEAVIDKDGVVLAPGSTPGERISAIRTLRQIVKEIITTVGLTATGTQEEVSKTGEVVSRRVLRFNTLLSRMEHQIDVNQLNAIRDEVHEPHAIADPASPDNPTPTLDEGEGPDTPSGTEGG